MKKYNYKYFVIIANYLSVKGGFGYKKTKLVYVDVQLDMTEIDNSK